MTGKYPKTSSVAFIAGYCILYYLMIWLGTVMFCETVNNSWAVLGRDTTRLKLVLFCSPVVGVLLGSWAASISVLSFTAMGSHRLGPTRFFGIGWFCILLGNMAVFSAALKLFINEQIGREWIQSVGEMSFKAWFFLLAPTLGYIGGVGATILINRLIEAQKS